MSYYREYLEKFLKTIDVKADRVLDIGGGSNPVKGRTKSWDVKEYEIWDNKAEGQKRKPDLIFDLNFPEVFGEAEIADPFDIIFCLEVSEYLYRPLTALRFIREKLKGFDSMVYLTFCSQYPVHNPREIDYLRYTRRGAEKLLQEAGFGACEIYSRPATKGESSLADFIRLEKLRAVKEDPIIYDLGYIVKCRK